MNEQDVRLLEAFFGTPLRDINAQGYPHWNLIQKDDENSILEMAVAGYAPEQISVKKDQNTLIITGDNSSYDTHIDYVRKGISSRKFNKEFTLGQYIDIAKVDMQNGLLIIGLRKNIPEEKKPKTYDIGFENKSLICG